MSEAGPSSPNATPSSSLAGTSTSTSVSRHSRFQFPNGDQHGPNSRTARPNGPTRIASSGLVQLPSSRRAGAAGGGAASSSSQVEEIRRRVKSVDAVEGPMAASRMQRLAEQDIDSRKRTMSTSRRPAGKGKGLAHSMEVPAGFAPVAFSDEYDLSHEDPRILEDVQRALKLKARREARLKAMQTNSSAKDTTVSSDQASGSSFSTYSSPVRTRLAEPPPITVPVSTTHNGESEIDFSPSVGPVPLHPIPSSSNGGATLDWTGSASEDERDKRWSISIPKRRHKDKSSFYVSKTSVEKQESLYVDKIARIKAKVKPHTLRKAAITGEQLQRRYSALLGTSGSGSSNSVTLLHAARWYSKQESVVQASLDNAEPLTWLKHLLEKRGKRSTRLPWHLTALIIEEYAKSVNRPEPMQSIPEEADSTHAPDSSPIVISIVSPGSKATSKSPSSGSWSWSPPPQALEPSLSRKRPGSDEGPVSFEPQVDSGRESAPESRRSSLEPGRHRMHSLTYGTDSTRSSLRSGVVSGRSLAVSPVSSRMQFREFTKRMRRKGVNGSEDGLSSARNSISEHSQEEGGLTKGKRPVSTKVLSEEGEAFFSDMGASSAGEEPSTATQAPSPYNASAETKSPQPDSQPQSEAPSHAPRPQPLRRKRMSLPSLHQILFEEQEKRQQQADEDLERLEYDRKAQMLDDTLAQNHRTRQLLQRVGANIREYENVQSSLAYLLDKPHTPISQDVLDAFSHDPASVTSGTRRFKSWRAVEDIQDRIIRQRDTLQTFVASIAASANDPGRGSIFEEPIQTLSHSLDELEERRRDIVHKAEQVAEALARVKDIHGTVKTEYNEVLAHTSLVYPELSHIVALEESYRNKYQQFWDIGLDALTLLLDTVTPVWRNYGKVIGEDVQDFLIIPWYRNEFTGEADRYPITRLPRRSLVHWLGLLLFCLVMVGITALQVGAAVSSTMNYNLPWIANTGFRWIVIPFFVVGLLIQWCAVLVECAMVLGQWAVVIWWCGWFLRIFH